MGTKFCDSVQQCGVACLCMNCRRLCFGRYWQILAGRRIPANANDPRWRRRDALHFHGKTKRKGGLGRKFCCRQISPLAFSCQIGRRSKSTGLGWPKKRQTVVESAKRTLRLHHQGDWLTHIYFELSFVQFYETVH